MAKQVHRAWFTEVVSGDVKLALVENTSRTVDGITDEWQAVTETGLTIYIEGTANDAMGYRDPRNKDLQSAEYFEMLYKKGEKRAKKMARTNYVEGSGRIIPQDF